MVTKSNFVIGNDRVSVTLDLTRGYFSLCGSITSGGMGQIVDTLRAATDDGMVQSLCNIWDNWQLKALDGHAMKAAERAQSILEVLDGQRIDAETATDSIDDADFNNDSDVIDSRDVIARIEYLRGIAEDSPLPEEYAAELSALEKLEKQAEDYAPDWQYGETLIRDSHFQEYAKQLADDIGAMNCNAKWPLNHIDWEAAAEELNCEYTAVDFDGATYWIR